MTGTGELTLEARLQRLEDLEEIRRLLLDYGVHLDGKEFGRMARLWAADGEIVNSQGAGSGPARGPEAIESLMTSMLGTDLATEPGDELHVFTNQIIEVDGDRATARTVWIYVTPAADGHPQVAQVGHYDDVLTRENGRWRFASRDWPRDIGVPGAGVPGVGASA